MFPQLKWNLGPTTFFCFLGGLSAPTYQPNDINPTMSVDPHPWAHQDNEPHALGTNNPLYQVQAK
jgi:hypothetical protein